MLLIQKLKKPSKKSGFNLKPGATSKIRGLTITNTSQAKDIYVDKYTRKKSKPKKKKKAKK